MSKVEVDFQFCKAVPISLYNATQIAIERARQDLFEDHYISEKQTEIVED